MKKLKTLFLTTVILGFLLILLAPITTEAQSNEGDEIPLCTVNLNYDCTNDFVTHYFHKRTGD